MHVLIAEAADRRLLPQRKPHFYHFCAQGASFCVVGRGLMGMAAEELLHVLRVSCNAQRATGRLDELSEHAHLRRQPDH